MSTPVLSVKDAALRTAVLVALADVVKKHADAARSGMTSHLLELAEETGASSVKVSLPDGEQVATISLTAGKPSARVTDERAFLAWVLEHRPGEVQQVVRPAFRTLLLDGATKAGAPVTADGELIPGVEISTGTPFVSTRFVPGTGKEAIARAWQDGSLPAELTALPGGVA